MVKSVKFWLKLSAGLIVGLFLLMVFVLSVLYIKWQSDNKVYQNNLIIQSFYNKEHQSNVLAIDGLSVGMERAEVKSFMYKHGFSFGSGSPLHLQWVNIADPNYELYGAVNQGLLCGFGYTVIVSYDESNHLKQVIGYSSDTGCV